MAIAFVFLVLKCNFFALVYDYYADMDEKKHNVIAIAPIVVQLE
jgi:hypothetical protein